MYEFTPVFCLSFHEGYGCRDRGSCCTSGWPIPVELDRAAVIERAMRGSPQAPHRPPVLTRDAGGITLTVIEGRCACYQPPGAASPGFCRVHRAAGHAALPLACRQFPRVCVTDPRGVFVTLSHYCPTAAEMLTNPTGSCVIRENAAGFPRDAEYDGLDARGALPPLLRPGMLMDWQSWSAWEHAAVDMLTNRAESAEDALAALRGIVEHVRGWSPARESLTSVIDAAFATQDLCHRNLTESGETTLAAGRRIEEAVAAIPAELRARYVEPWAHTTSTSTAPPSDAIVRRFLAAHAFANWTGYLGQGLRTWLRSIEAAHALVSRFGVADADLLLRHLADPAALAQTWSAADTDRLTLRT